jgi:hypothetical protein
MSLEQGPGDSAAGFAPIERSVRPADRPAGVLIDSIVSGRRQAPGLA